MQVLALGLSRSGTDSLRTALNELGYNHVYHGFNVGTGAPNVRKAWSDLGEAKWTYGKFLTREDFEPLLSHCEAVTDQPCACFALEVDRPTLWSSLPGFSEAALLTRSSKLIEAYPEAKVILNHREFSAWFLSFFETSLYWRRRCFLMYRNYFFQGSIPRNARRIHQEHYAMIRGSMPSERLLEWKVQDGWEPLCRFLDKPLPDKVFPNGNSPAQLWQRIEEAHAVARRRAYANIGLAASSLMTGAGLAVYHFWNK